MGCSPPADVASLQCAHQNALADCTGSGCPSRSAQGVLQAVKQYAKKLNEKLQKLNGVRIEQKFSELWCTTEQQVVLRTWLLPRTQPAEVLCRLNQQCSNSCRNQSETAKSEACSAAKGCAPITHIKAQYM